MRLAEYLKDIETIVCREDQQRWFHKLETVSKKGLDFYESSDSQTRSRFLNRFRNRIRTEELKAWYSAPETNSLFQGTSVSSLTIPHTLTNPLNLDSVTELEESIADAYIALHDRYAGTVRSAIPENIDCWISQGLFYGVVVGAKVISQAFGLHISHEDVIFQIDGYTVDPHEITSYPQPVRRAYFEQCRRRITCFEGIELEQRELESSLVLADISKPKMDRYKGKILLAPVRCNEIAALISQGVVRRIVEKTHGRITPHGLTVVIYDTDTPYTYHAIMGYDEGGAAPVLPGLTVLGASGTIDAFRWLYAYRTSLIAQKIQKGSLYSQVQKCFMPFVFLGVLVWRDAEILLEMDNLSMLRYRGNVSPDIEFAYVLEGLRGSAFDAARWCDWHKFRKDHCMNT